MDDAGWHWFEEDDSLDEAGKNLSQETTEAFARTFRSADGQVVLRHLMALTLRRHLGPNAPDAMLRHLEGQRQLVGYLFAMIDRGGGRAELESTLHVTPKAKKRKSLWTRIF